jgi:potassium voltage-gated channel Shal-related subfamily D protein 2
MQVNTEPKGFSSLIILRKQYYTFSQTMSQNAPIPLSRIRHAESYELSSEDPQDVTDIDGFQPSFSLDMDVPDVNQPLWKQDLHALLEQPTSSSSAFFAHVFISFLIVVSAVITILETVPTFHSISSHVWFGLETSLVALFTLEYVARCLAWSSTWKSSVKWVFCKC